MEPHKEEPPMSHPSLPILRPVLMADRAQPRPPPVFTPGDDFDLWETRIKYYLRLQPVVDLQSFILGYLSDGAARRFLNCRLPHDSSPEVVWGRLKRLFGDPTPSGVYLERFLERRQGTTEPVRDYLGALQELALRAFPDASAEEVDKEVLRRFSTGIHGADARVQLLRKPPATLDEAVDTAISFEMVEQTRAACSALSVRPNHNAPRWYPPRPPAHRRPLRDIPPANTQDNCPHCNRVRRRGRRRGYSSHSHWDVSSGELIVPLLLATMNAITPAFTFPGLIDERQVRVLVDTGASCSVVRPGITTAAIRPPSRRITLTMANGTQIPVRGYASLTLGLEGNKLVHEFLVAPTNWDVIVGMDILTRYGVHIDVRARKLSFKSGSNSDHCVSTFQVSPDWIDNLLPPTKVPPTHRASLVRLLSSYADVFDVNRTTPGRTNLLQHSIDTGDHRPIRQACRRVPIHQQAELEHMLHEMLSKNIIRPSSSPWASPIVLVKKKDGSLRFCVDYRRLNAITEKDSFPLPRIDATLDAVSGAKFFSTLDLASGYWQVEICPQDRAKTAFVVPSGLYEFETMPFGLTNAPATFQRLMQQVLDRLVPRACLVYLDDIIIHGTTIAEHNDRLNAVLARLRAAGLTLKTSKCKFLREEVPYLGHILSEKGTQVDPNKTNQIVHWPTPKSVTDVRSFLGLASYYRKYVRGFADIAAPLHRLTEKGRSFVWTNECANAFDRLKTALTSPPILALPDTSPTAAPFILDTDASDLAIGAVLSQEQDGMERAIAYASRGLDKRERHYCTTRREMLALVFFLKHFRPYLLGKPFIVRTDHHSLQWLQNFKDPLGQVARWQEQLQEYDFTCQYRRGSQHGNADALSRRPQDHSPVIAACQLATDSLPWATLQEADPDIQFIYRRQKSGASKPTGREMKGHSTAARCLWNLWPKILFIDGVLYIRSPDNEQPRVVVPRALVQEIITRIHLDIGHAGQRKTETAVRQRFWWPLIHHDVTVFCQHCDTCQRVKAPAPLPKAPLQPIAIEGPNHRVGVDLMGPLPVSKHGNRYILVMVDYFTKWCEAVPLKQQDALSVASAIVNEWICRYGVPHIIHSDQGSAFENQVLRSVCRLLRVDKTKTTPYHPQGNGLVERTNRTLKAIMQTVIDRDHSDSWDTFLPTALLAYRATVHTSTGYSPSLLRLGQEMRLPEEIGKPLAPAETIDYDDFARHLQRHLSSTFQSARETLQSQQQHQKSGYDRTTGGPTYNRGDLVLLYRPRPTPGMPPKFHQPWLGPYEIVMCRSPTVYVLRDPQRPSADVLTVHYNQLKPYRRPTPPLTSDPTPSSSTPLPPTSFVEIPPEGGQGRELPPPTGTEDSAYLRGGINVTALREHRPHSSTTHQTFSPIFLPGRPEVCQYTIDERDAQENRTGPPETNNDV